MIEKIVIIEKTDEKNAIPINISISNFFTLKYAFFVAKLFYTILNSFINIIAVFLKYYLAKSEIFLSKL